MIVYFIKILLESSLSLKLEQSSYFTLNKCLLFIIILHVSFKLTTSRFLLEGVQLQTKKITNIKIYIIYFFNKFSPKIYHI